MIFQKKKKGSYWVEGVSADCSVLFRNETDQPVKLVWVDTSGNPQPYGEILPRSFKLQETFTTHKWQILDVNGELLAEHIGETSKVFVREGGKSEVQPWDKEAEIKAMKSHPAYGEYATRMQMGGIEIFAFSVVSEEAVMRTHHVLSQMLGNSPAVVVKEMVFNGSKVAIISKHQKTSDIPEHHFVTLNDGRSVDETRGLGGTLGNPVCSVGEENMLMVDDPHYPNENIFIHEMAHSVKTLGLSNEQRARITACYKRAYESGTYNNEAYIMQNEDEYWAEATQAWFEATIREVDYGLGVVSANTLLMSKAFGLLSDVTSGINTRGKLKAHDPMLAELMIEVYGDGSWRYQHDSPAKFVKKGQKQILDVSLSPATHKMAPRTLEHKSSCLDGFFALFGLQKRTKEA